MNWIRKYFKKRRLRKDLFKWQMRERAILRGIRDGAWEINNPFIVSAYKEANSNMDRIKNELNNI